MPAPGPTTPILDTFDRANETPLSGGGNWLSVNSSTTAPDLSSNHVVIASTNGGSYWTPLPFLSDFEVYATMDSGTLNAQGLIGRAKDLGGANTWDGYAFFTFGITSIARIFIYSNAVATVLASVQMPVAAVAGDKFMFRGIGPMLQGWHYRSSLGFWQCILSVSDTTFSTGYIGLFYGNGVGSTLDDFGGGVPIPSPTLSAWTLPTSGFGLGANFNAVTYGDGVWVAVGSSGIIYRSTDGIVWAQQTSPFGASVVNAVAHSVTQGLWVAVADSGKLATSPDGITWALQTSSFGATDINRVAHHEETGLWVAVGDAGTLANSTDGITDWTQQTSGFGASNINGVAVSDAGLWVVAGLNGKLATSSDTTGWSLQTSGFGASFIFDVAYGNGLWVAVGQSGILTTSPDGTVWTARTSSTTTTIEHVYYIDDVGLWFIGASTKLASSSDGVGWSIQAHSLGSASINGIGYGAGTAVLISVSPRFAGVAKLAPDLNVVPHAVVGRGASW